MDPHESRRKDDNPPGSEVADLPEVIDGEVVGTTREDNASASPNVTMTAEDAATYQEFLEFRKFQEWRRQHGGIPAADTTDRPWWKRALLLLRYKAVRRLLYFLVALVLIYTAMDHYFGGGSSPDNARASRVPGNNNPAESPVQGANPPDPIKEVYRSIAYGVEQTTACAEFTPQAGAEFAAANGAPDCPTAVQRLHGQVTVDPNIYKANAFTVFQQNPVTGVNGQAEVPACSIVVQGGPHLGTFHLQQLPNRGWRIDGYQSPPEQCPPS